ncbi:MAG TPA: hypothetical protein VGK10_16755 [Prolixibacteraceae bacterium]|jgi:hypothetical protein
MKSLFKIFFGIASAVIFSSCTLYQHVKLEGNIPLTKKSEFLLENDSMRIIYSFNGQSGPIHLTIFNKSDKPFYVDWEKSALIMNGESFSLWKDVARLSGTASGYQINPTNETTISSNSFEGSIVKKDKVTFIPPQAKILVNSYTLYSKLLDTPSQTGELMKVKTLEGKREATKFSFSKENSPLTFRIYISFSADENLKTTFHIDNTFWVSDYFTCYTSPQVWSTYQGNLFYNWFSNY